ncbi:MAG: AraC family transcriptional regulator [Acutalibacteraceae bacterium]
MLHDEFMSLKESTQHGDFLLPFVVCTTLMPQFFSYYPIHWHNEMEIVYIESGELLETVDLCEYNATAGDIILIRPCLLHSFKVDSGKQARMKTLIFNLSMLAGNTTDACSIKYFTPFSDGQYSYPCVIHKTDAHYDELLALIKSMVELYEYHPPLYELEIKAKLFSMFAILFRGFFEREAITISITDNTTRNIKTILDYICNNYMNPITIDELANCVNLSKHYFMRFFKKYMGVTCIEYINDYRLNIATNLLLTTNMPITEVATNIGITNLSYFNRIFKKKYGMTPKEYRRTMDTARS